MKKRPLRLGDLLVELGRVSPDDVESALDHQRQHGGFLGDALIRLGALTSEELRWSLANQHSIPFVHLRAENIDPGLAAYVPEPFARENLVLPVLHSGDSVTVVLSDPAHLERAEEVRRMTGAPAFEAALSSPERILELIDAVYGLPVGPALSLEEMIGEALRQGVTALGVSVRGRQATGWYRVAELVRRTLGPSWRAELEEIVRPWAPGCAKEEGRTTTWPATLQVDSGRHLIDCWALERGGELEWAAKLRGPVSYDLTAARIDSETRAAAMRALQDPGTILQFSHSGAASPDEHTAEGAMALLPNLLAARAVRSIHLTDRAIRTAPGVLSVLASGDLGRDIDAFAHFELDALTVAVDGLRASDLRALIAGPRIRILYVRGNAHPGAGPTVPIYLQEKNGLLWTRDGGT